MPVHDWTRVFPGTFHDFHCAWITHLKEALNNGVLPPDFYALAEQHGGDVIPDVLTLTRAGRDDGNVPTKGGVLVAESPPRVSLRLTADEDAAYRALRRTIAIRHRSRHEIVAMIEIVSPSTKSHAKALDQFVDKSVSALRHGIHLLVVDLFPPTSRDPEGIHGAIWSLVGGAYAHPVDKPLALAAYVADQLPEAYVEPMAIGQEMADMPLFLDVTSDVLTPLKSTYAAAYRGVPEYVRDIVEGRAEQEWAEQEWKVEP